MNASSQRGDSPSDATARGTVSRVRRTGIALVHEGEYVVSAPDSEAAFEAVPASEGDTVHYHFPVEIVVVGSPDDDELDRIETHIWTRFQDALERAIR